MIASRMLRSLVIFTGSWALMGTATVLAAGPNATTGALARQRFLNLVERRNASGNPTQDIPLPRNFVAAFNRNHFNYVRQHGHTPPPIPRLLLVQPRSPFLQQRVDFQRAFILELYRQKAEHRPDGIAGGVFFGPGNSNRLAATPFTPVAAVNIFDFFPVFRTF